MTKPQRPPDFDPDYVRDISLAVYLDRLGPDGSKKAIAEAGGIEVVRKRAGSHDPLTKAYLRAHQTHPQPFKLVADEPKKPPRKTSLRGRKGPDYVPKPARKTK